MSGMVVYSAVKGLVSLTNEDLISLVDTTEETIGVDETTEHVLNGTNPTTTTNWTAGSNTTLSAVSNRLRVTSDANGASYGYQALTTIIGRTYFLTFDYDTDTTTGNTFFDIGTTIAGFDNAFINMQSVTGTYTFIFKATATTTYIALFNSSSTLAGEYSEFNNISVKETGILVENHNFLDSTNAQWTLGDAAATISGGSLSVDGSQSTIFYVTQNNILTNLTTYVVTYTISNYVAGFTQAQVSGHAGTSRGANGTYTETLTTTLGINLGFWFDGDFDGDIDDVSIRLAVPDLSDNLDGLEVHGEVTKTPVNTGAELMAYSNFTAFNKLKQINTGANINIGTGGFALMFWLKVYSSAASTMGLFSWQEADDATNRVQIQIGSDGSFDGYFTSLPVPDMYAGDLRDDLYRHYCVTRRDGVMYAYVDDVEVYSWPSTADIEGATTPELVIGGLNLPSSGGYPLTDGEMTLVKYIGESVTQQQVKNIRAKELPLFSRNALYSAVGEEKTLSLDSSRYNRNTNEISKLATGLSGITARVHQSDDRLHNITTGYIHRDNLNAYRDFMEATRRAEIFTIDPYADADAVNEPIEVQRVSKGYSEDRVAKSNYYTISFQAKELGG